MLRRWTAVLRDPDLRRLAVRRFLRSSGMRPSRRRADDRGPQYLSRDVDGSPLQKVRLPYSVPSLVPWGTASLSPGPHALRLASETIEAQLPELPWTRAFADPEDTFAMHRFGWLGPWLLERALEGASASVVSDIVSAAIERWVASHSSIGGAAWQPYTVAERLVNWVIASGCLGRRLYEEQRTRSSIAGQLDYLSTHLEFHGDALTGNHLCNNGRGLYVAGLAIGEDTAVQLGRRILLEERQRLLEEPCFVREGSTHYQFLVTRNYVEALWFAERAGDAAFAREIASTVSALVRGCQFFLVADAPPGWQFPLLGDISPDCAPSWLRGVPAVGSLLLAGDQARSDACRIEVAWHSQFGVGSGGPGPGPTGINSREWARVDHAGWTILTHANASGSCRYHAHQDTGALVAYYRGTPVVVDAGRTTYRDTALGRWGRDVWSHSACVVDRMNPSPYWHWAYSDDDLAVQRARAPQLTAKEASLEVSHMGFGRRHGVGRHRRTVAVDVAGLSIGDHVDGDGRHQVDVTMHIAAPGRQHGDDLLFDFGGFGARLVLPSALTDRQQVRASRDGRAGWAAVAYGQSVPVTTVRARGSVSLPWSGTTRFAIE